MIVTELENLQQYYGVCPALEKVSAYLLKNANPELGKQDLGDGDYVNVMEYETKESNGVFEAHRQYLDVQILLTGTEKIFVQAFAEGNAKTDYDEEKDCQLFFAEVGQEVYLKEGVAAIFFPHDLHRPSVKIAEAKQVKKAVFKIKINKEENK